MNWTLIQIFVDVALGVGLFVMWTRLKRPPQDDPRLSRGLQLLQSKITVLEDLSDRTDVQVKQLSHLLDQKTRVIQDKIVEADRQNFQIHESMQKSLEVAEIFQDRIPHEDIVERQKTIHYVNAAKMANAGNSVEEICAAVALPREQIELIAKFNREELMFNEEALPEWAKGTAAVLPKSTRSIPMVDEALPQRDIAALENLGKKFKEACVSFDEREQEMKKEHPATTFIKSEVSRTADVLRDAADGLSKKLAQSASQLLESKLHETKLSAPKEKVERREVQKVQFPRI